MARAKRARASARRAGLEGAEGARAGARDAGRVSAAIDLDERIWRPLGAGAGAISRLAHARMQSLAHELWLTNLMGQRLIEIVTDHVVGEGVSWHSEDERALRTVRAFWSDPVNQMDIRFERLVSELGVFGELLLPLAVSRFEGRVRLGYVSPRLIEEVVMDPDNCALAIGVVLRAEGPGGAARRQRRIRTALGGDPRGYLGAAARRERARFTDGEAFLFQINKASDAARGSSDLLAAIDWIDAYERFIFDAVERARLQNSFIYDVTLKGAGPEQIADWLAENGVAPRPSSVRVHNEKEHWQAVSPDLKGGESGAQGVAKMVRGLLLGGAGIPSHWFAQGEDVNRASAESMDQPTLKKMTRRQRTVRHLLQIMADRQLEEARRAGALPGEALRAGVSPVLPEISVRDAEKISQALSRVSDALATATERGWMSDAAAGQLVRHIAGQFGMSLEG